MVALIKPHNGGKKKKRDGKPFELAFDCICREKKKQLFLSLYLICLLLEVGVESSNAMRGVGGFLAEPLKASLVVLSEVNHGGTFLSSHTRSPSIRPSVF